jgi:hypothetical protein
VAGPARRDLIGEWIRRGAVVIDYEELVPRTRWRVVRTAGEGASESYQAEVEVVARAESCEAVPGEAALDDPPLLAAA